MGLEFLFAPITVVIFIALNIGAVLLQRLLSRRAFELLRLKGVVTGYAFVLILSLLIGGWQSGGTFRGFATHFLLVSYLSLMVVSIGLLPSSLWLASRGKFSVGALVLVGIAMWTLLVLCTVWIDGLERVIERGTGWLSMQASALGFLVAVSAAFSAGLRAR